MRSSSAPDSKTKNQIFERCQQTIRLDNYKHEMKKLTSIKYRNKNQMFMLSTFLPKKIERIEKLLNYI
jgi:hypothetical protein